MKNQELGAGTLFIPFKDAPSYEKACEIAPGAAIIARTFGGYIAFSSLDLYRYWMRDK